MPLIPILPLADLPTVEDLGKVHFIGIGGSGMNSVARILMELGVQVSGSDRQDSKYLQALRAHGARVHVGHRADQLGDADTLVTTQAIRDTNPEVVEAQARGLRILHRSAVSSAIMRSRRGVAVAGTHGKTTTTAMIAQVLAGAGRDPSYLIGGALTGSDTGGRLGTGDVLVVEADESDGTFLQYPREVAVVTNVDPDHLVNWGTPENYADGFLRFATENGVRVVVISADEPGAVALTQRIRDRADAPEVITFGETEGADVHLADIQLSGMGSTFELTAGELDEATVGQVALGVPGRYNVWNAAATYAVTRWLGLDDETIRRELNGYVGTYRRFQLVGEVDGIRVFDDYGHHPTEVANTVRAARVAAGDGRVVVCFQPHLYTRTRDFWQELAGALEPADEAIVMDVCGDREDPLPGIDGRLVADAIAPGTAHVTYQPDWDAAAPTVAGLAQSGDLVITVGCGDVTKVAPLIVTALQSGRSSDEREDG
jgi:UDP-N-acetylmuramate--alanine ligase